MAPPLSLAMPVRNGERFVAAAIASLRAQTFADFELIIVDNASTDTTSAICERLAAEDGRIRYLRNSVDIGAGANFNRGVELARGELFKWCAHDDLINPEYLERCVAALAADASAVTAYGRLVGVDAAGELTGYMERPLPPNGDVSPARRFGMLMRRQGLDAAIFGVHRRQTLAATSLHQPYYGSDCTLLAELALLGSFVHAPEAVLFSRDHPTRSVNLAREQRLTWQAPQRGQANAHEFSSRVRHHFAVAWRHRDRAPFPTTAADVAIWAAHPVRFGRLTLEAVGEVSPRLRTRLRSVGVAALRRFDGAGGAGRRDA